MKSNKQSLIFSWIISTVLHVLVAFVVGRWALQSIISNYEGFWMCVCAVFLVYICARYVFLSFLDDMRFFIGKKDETDM